MLTTLGFGKLSITILRCGRWAISKTLSTLQQQGQLLRQFMSVDINFLLEKPLLLSPSHFAVRLVAFTTSSQQ
jgi:hypothetical protein